MTGFCGKAEICMQHQDYEKCAPRPRIRALRANRRANANGLRET